MQRSRLLLFIGVVLVILAVVIFLYRRSASRREPVEGAKQAVKIAPPIEKATGRPGEPGPGVPTEKGEVPSAIEVPPTEPPVPIPVPSAKCDSDSRRTTKARSEAAPEGMVYVPGGEFVMGNPAGTGHEDENPPRSVCINGFYIDKFEVTNAKFKEFVEATGYVTDSESGASSTSERTWRQPYGPGSNAEEMSNYPVVCVSWNDANAYAVWADKRLPTEAEWEKAARGTDRRIYPWGNKPPEGKAIMNVADKSSTLRWRDPSIDDGYERLAPVGSFPEGRSIYGVEDMAGNAGEWCLDWWSDEYYQTKSTNNPIGPEAGEFRVVRGGDWFSDAFAARATHRLYSRPNSRGSATGFRCVKDVAK